MERTKASDYPPGLLDLSREHQHEHIDRRSFLNGVGRFAVGALTAGAIFEIVRPNDAWARPELGRRARPELGRRASPEIGRRARPELGRRASPELGRGARQAAKVSHPASARVLDRLRSQFTFQISVDVATVEQGLRVAGAALTGGITIVEMGTPLLKNEGVSNVVPAFRRKFPDALLLADMKTMDGGAFEARAVYAGGGNIVDFLALAGADTAKAICAVRDEFRGAGGELPRLVFADIMVPHQGPATQAVEVALRMLEAGVDGVGIHLQADARRADPTLIAKDYLGDLARVVFERVGKSAPVQVVGGLNVAQAKSLAQAGLRAFVISGNLGEPDTRARYDLPPDQIQRHVSGFIAAVSGA